MGGSGRRPRLLRIVIPLIVLTAGIAATELLVHEDGSQRHDDAMVLAQGLGERFRDSLEQGLQPTENVTNVLGAYVRGNDGELDHVKMDRFLVGVTELLPHLRSVAVAPGNRVEYISPLKGNEAALGLYYPDNPAQWPAIQEIMASGLPTLVGPISLVQGGMGLAYRLPVFLSGQVYWGVLSTVIDSDAYLTAAAAEAQVQGVPIALRAVDDEGNPSEPFWGMEQAFDENPVIVDVHPLGATWEAAVVPLPTSSSSAAITRILGYSLAFLVALLLFALIGAVQRRQELTKRLSRLSERVPGMLYEMRVTADGRTSFPYVSQGIEQMFGLFPHEVRDDARPLFAHVVKEDFARVRANIGDAAASGQLWHQQVRMHDRDGHERWYLTEATPEATVEGGTLWHGFITDMSDEMAAQDRLRVSASVYESTHDGVVIMDPDARITEINPGFTALTGYPIDEVRGRTLEMLGPGLTPDAVYQDMYASLERHDFWRGELVGRLHDGSMVSQSVAVTAVRDDGRALSHFVAIVSSLNSLRDDLATGLPNRQVLEDRLTQAVERARLSGGHMALIAVGIDHFRDINEVHGHRAGDLVLKETARRLRTVVPAAETVARLGGDEFAILLGDTTDSVTVEHIAAMVALTVSEPFMVGDQEVRWTCSAGVSLFPEDAHDSSTLLMNANQAMRFAKGHGRNRHRYFTAEMHAEAVERGQLTEDLRRAIPEGHLHMVFQPIVETGTGRILKCEALVRWQHPERGAIGPASFIPIAEKSGLIKEIGDWVFGEVLAMSVQARAIVPAFEVGFNMSPIEVADDTGLHVRRLQRMRDQRIAGSALVVEITEGLLLDRGETVTANLKEYRSAGFQFAIDDFGTGYSSLAYLQELDVDYLKIDQSFVSGLVAGSENLALCEAIIEMAHKLGLGVIAEGIETEPQRRLLAAASCDFGQGYLLSRPVPADAFLALLEANASDLG